MVECGVEHALLLLRAVNLHLLQLLLPGIAQALQLLVEAVRIDVAACLHGADEADTHLNIDQSVSPL